MMTGLPIFPAVSFEKTEDYPNFAEVLKETQATALVIIDDLFAVRIMQLATLLGYKVPDDLSVISFNNSIFSTLIHPYLTSIDIDVASLGEIATQQLMTQLTKTEAQSSLRVVVPHELIQRETVLNKHNMNKTYPL